MIPVSSNVAAVNNPDEMVIESKCKRKVSFYSSVLARIVPTVAEYSPEEIRSIWYDNSDYKMFASMVKHDLINHQTSGMSTTCRRGLEKFSETGRETRRRRRLSSLSAVLSSPRDDKSSSSSSKSADVIAMQYMLVSGPCHLEAQFVGLCDEAAARAAFDEANPWSSLDDMGGTHHNKMLVLSKNNLVRSSRPISCSPRSGHWGPLQELQAQNKRHV
jgi:hypothetical protein